MALTDRSVSSTVSVGTLPVVDTLTLGPSSRKLSEVPRFSVAEPVLVSPSRSVMVSVRVSVTRSAALSVTASFGLLVSGCDSA